MANRDPEQRPSPDALLEAARRESDSAGRLKIFVGAAPGVGKTYEMLQSAHAKRKAGVDVVVGAVETHGRAETEALLRGLEVIPRKKLEYKDQTLEEMDLDALIARRPKIALVDELAHTNAPGSRHPKRYLDVEELLSHGIDVYTAVNIQHIESLNDVVAQITHVRVRETVPDFVFDRADAIELIDLTPDDLIQRLKEGKVYVPKQAERALEHYFSPGNLTALRELALRRTADRVDEQLLTHMQANAIAGPWAAGERILVCLSEDPRSAGLVRYTKRLADRLHAQWTAISIETRRSLQLTDEQRDRLADTLRLAEALGGEAITIPGVGRRIADDIVSFAQANNVTQIIIGKSTRSWWFEIRRGSVVHDLVRRAGNITVNVIAGEELAAEPVPKKTVRTAERQEPFKPVPYAISLLMVAVALGASLLIYPLMGIENVDLVFLTAVVSVAARYGLWPSVLASVVASLCYNFFFLPPVYTFTITDPTNVAAFFFFMLVAILVSNVAARVRTQADTAIGRVRTTESLYAFSRKLAGTATLDDVLVGDRLSDRVDAEGAGGAAVAGGRHALRSRPAIRRRTNSIRPISRPPTGRGATIAPAGRGSDTLPGAKRLFLPMRTGRGAIGVIGIDDDRTGPLLTPDQRRLLDALVDQGALAIERVLLVEDMDRVKRTVESDRLRGALLTSISHDLKTPLASVLGAASTLRDLGAGLNEAQKSRSARHHDRRIRAAQPFHRQSARHDQARIRRHRAQHRAARSRRDRRQRAAARRQDPRASHGVAGARPPICRCWSSMPCCSSRCCSTCSTTPPNTRLAGTTISIRGNARRGRGLAADARRGRRHPAGRAGERLRQVLSRAEGRSRPRRHRSWTCDLARLRRGHARHDHGRQPHATAAARCSPFGCRYRPTRQRSGYRRMNAPADQGSGHRRRAADPQAAADGAEHARLRHPGGLERQDGAREARRGAGADHPRSRSARHPGPRTAAHDPRPQRERADRRAVEPRRRGRQGAGARSRRRRLSDQAVRHGRAAGAHARGAAPSVAGAGRAAGVSRRAICRSIWCAASSRSATARSSCRRRNTTCCACWCSTPARC